MDWFNELSQLWAAGDHAAVETRCRQELEMNPEMRDLYWHLGLALLFKGEEEDANLTWMSGMMDGSPEQVEQWTVDLNDLLEEAANRQESLSQIAIAWTIRQYQREISPSNVRNLLKLIQLSVRLQNYSGSELEEWGVIDALRSPSSADADGLLVFHTLQALMKNNPCDTQVLDLIDVSHGYLASAVPVATQLYAFLSAATEVAYAANRPLLGVEYVHRCLKIAPGNVEVLGYLSDFYHEAGAFEQAIATAKTALNESTTLPDQLSSSFNLLRSLSQSGGRWHKAMESFEDHRRLMQQFIDQSPTELERATISRLVQAPFALPYYKDDAAINRQLQNGFMAICQDNLQSWVEAVRRRHGQQTQPTLQSTAHLEQLDQLAQTEPQPQLLSSCVGYQHNNVSSPSASTTRLKIGYVSYCFRTHSVGWLSRWLIRYHDRTQFELYGYFLNYRSHINDSLQTWFKEQFEHSYLFGRDGVEVAQQIEKDAVDILIDLDSITADLAFEAIALNPAPVQVTWLGWDASSIPAVDYFVADPYVLPSEAESYYNETLWRLPQTFIAVDGFEVGIPNLRREHLDIPDSAVIFLSAQSGQKRYPDTIRLQMEILKHVPDSYFLIKGKSDHDATQQFFKVIADEVGLSFDRLRFLPLVLSEATHRANLAIADVVLDTYPYNGATTTLETLWMGIPLVTRVGQQFSARNSYTMMRNVGVQEGIAWTDEEYVEWGIRLGTDAQLREDIHWKLLRSRHTSPLWNSRQFAQEMETAYRQMWAIWKETQ